MKNATANKPVFLTLMGLAAYLLVECLFAFLWALPHGVSYIPKYFWTLDMYIPDPFITWNFSPTHICWAVTTVIFIVLTVFVFRRQSEKTRNRVLLVLAIFIVSIELIDWIWYIIIGHYSLRNNLPLHLCSISVFLEAAAIFASRNKLLKEFTYALSMPAAFMALLTPGWTYPFISFQYLRSAMSHSLLILIPVLLVWGSGFRPDYRRLPRCFLLLMCFVGMAAGANALFDSNYMFLSYVPGDTTLQVFERWFGHPGYIFVEVVLLMIIWIILYTPWIIADRKHRQHDEQ